MAFDGSEVYKNLEVGFKEACLAIIYHQPPSLLGEETYRSFLVLDHKVG